MTDSRETTPMLGRASYVWPLLVALLGADDGEVFISSQMLVEAATFNGSIAVEQVEDGARYRLVEATEDTRHE